MNTVSTFLTPGLVESSSLEGKISVVVDIFRATSCMVTGFANGVSEIMPFTNSDECKSMKQKGFYTAGERGGKKLDGFDLGNSPFDYMEPYLKGSKVAVTTTNGTEAVHSALGSGEILIGAFLNLKAISERILNSKKDVVIICAGWRNRVNLEDTLFAGALISRIKNRYTITGDSASLAWYSFINCKDQLQEALSKSDHAKRLGNELFEDIRLCSTMDKYNVVPYYDSGVLLPS